MENELREFIDPLVRLAKEAGEKILYWYEHPSLLQTERKADQSLLTSADIAANEVLCRGLQNLFPEWPILSEEGVIAAFDERKQWDRYWLLDPLDGTQGFTKRLDEFTVNIALIEGGRSVLGVVYSPVEKCCCFAYRGGGAFIQLTDQKPLPIRTRPIDFEEIRFIVGRYHNSKRLKHVQNQLPGSMILRVNSSLKFLWIAQGRADVYPRFGDINEWDIAAGHCILEEAGGNIVCFDGTFLEYNRQASLLCPPFMALGDAGCADRLIQLFQEAE